VNEIDPAITELLERARPAPPAAERDWEDVLRRSRRGHRRFPVPMRGVLLAAAVLIGLGAAAQAETGVFPFATNHTSSHPGLITHRRRVESVDQATHFGILAGLPHGMPRRISSVTWASAARMAQTFGGSVAGYPAGAGIVVVRGPFSIPLYLQGCAQIPYACPAPIGNWAWLAYSVQPPPKAGRMSRLPDVRLLRAAPAGTPLPRLGLLGHVRKELVPPTPATTVDSQHQGTMTVVTRRGRALTEAHVQCVYAATGYTTPLCGPLARYDAYLRTPHPDDRLPAAGNWTRISGDLGGWRGNLVITADRLSHAPAHLRAAITAGLAATHGTPITRVPAALPCVRNPIACFRSGPVKIHQVVEVLNRHGLGVRRIAIDQIPARYRRLVPSGLHIAGAATNAGSPQVATRGYVLTMTFERAVAFAILQPLHTTLGQHWGVFIEGNTLTLLHPFFAPTLPHPIAYYGHKRDALIRDMHKMETQLLRHRDQNRVGRLIGKALHRLTTG
jgi:hypothetical protein